MKNDDIYICSVDKRISMRDFKSKYYKIGHAYMLNSGYIHKCVGYDGYYPIVEIICILDRVNEGDIQIIYYPPSKSHALPSMDFVNGIMSGKYKEIDSKKYDSILNKIRNFSSEISLQTKEAYGK